MNNVLQNFLVIGDIAGHYETLKKLMLQCPNNIPISIGDMIDRGPNSKAVLDFFMNNGKALLGNHEHMFIDFYKDTGYYEKGLWAICNGGFETIKSFIESDKKYCLPCFLEIEETINNYNNGYIINSEKLKKLNNELLLFSRSIIDKKYIKYLESLPLFLEENNYIITHAPINPSIDFKKLLDLGEKATDKQCDRSVIWNRGKTRRRKNNKFQIHGHCANKNITYLKDKQGIYGVNLDSSKGNILSAMNIPTNNIYKQKFIEA